MKKYIGSLQRKVATPAGCSRKGETLKMRSIQVAHPRPAESAACSGNEPGSFKTSIVSNRIVRPRNHTSIPAQKI
ncbi:hypothetical protein E2R51_15860 [Jeotgalibacillus sp. S-D1]|uniref:hypothetical protein n=1 Tax=Jeotgalibacillus sp. S-D1 TaxID=2552189 RepID=UPI001059780A|nr:hypothetical protein [Jeotgalibacillus sp. S-D1]TDL30805.1 hypothetical protein E2R51_15860 [Jeotgalibacillus sp. S-D1]